MYMVFISYKESINSRVMDILNSLEIKSFTKWPQVQDTPEEGRPRFGTHVWPGFNSAILSPIPETKVEELFNKIKAFNENTKFEGIKAYSMKLEHFIE